MNFIALIALAGIFYAAGAFVQHKYDFPFGG